MICLPLYISKGKIPILVVVSWDLINKKPVLYQVFKMIICLLKENITSHLLYRYIQFAAFECKHLH